MADTILELSGFGDAFLDGEALLTRLTLLREITGRRMQRWMGYYRNPMTDLISLLPYSRNASLSMRPYRQYQEIGLPTRITGFRHTVNGQPVLAGPLDSQRKEVVIENDIAWRINTLVDFAAGEMPVMTSTAGDAGVRDQVEAALEAVFEGSGGVSFLQELTLLGAIHGSAYVVLHPTDDFLAAFASGSAGGAAPANHQPTPEGDETGLPNVLPNLARGAGSDITSAEAHAPRREPSADVLALARGLRLQTVEASRVLPILDPEAPRSAPEFRYCAILNDGQAGGGEGARDGGNAGRKESTFQRVTRWLTGGVSVWPEPDPGLSFDLWGSGRWQRYVAGVLVDEGSNPLGFVPVVAFINHVAPPSLSSSPAGVEGLSEVEPLIGLQDELNTRLSDRANRVTMQSFKMYSAHGIEDFISRPVGPGQMWSTDNPSAKIESFGGDGANPSEDTHVREIREALDKISAVPPAAGGQLSGRIGHLSSAVALRVTLIALLSRTAKRRGALERTLKQLARRVLEVLDQMGAVKTGEGDRGVEIHWPSPIPENLTERLQEARMKLDLGVKQEVVLKELGYGEEEGGGVVKRGSGGRKLAGDGLGEVPVGNLVN